MKNQRLDAAFEMLSIDDFLSIHEYFHNQREHILPKSSLIRLVQTWKAFQDYFESDRKENEVFKVKYERLRENTADQLLAIYEFLTHSTHSIDFQSIADKWNFDSAKMASNVKQEHITSKKIAYGKSLFSPKLQQEINNELREVSPV
jgi:hypothetical protein